MLGDLRNLGVASLVALAPAGAFAQTVVSQEGGALRLTTSNGGQSVRVESAGAGAVRVFGFPGLGEGAVYSGVSAIAVVTGAGEDKVELDLETSQNFSAFVDTQGGASETLVKWRVFGGAAGVAARLDLRSAEAGEQRAAAEFEVAANDAAIALSAPFATDIATKIAAPNASNALRIDFSAAAPKTALEVTSAAASLALTVAGGVLSAPGDLKYKVDQTRIGAVRIDWALDGGAGSDVVEANISAPGSRVVHTGLVRGRGGADSLVFETSAFGTETGLTLNGGPGDDVLRQIVKGRFLASQTLQPRLFGLDGSDELVLTTDTGIFGTGEPNDLFPIVDCGAGVDRFNAFGLIRSCESRL